MVFKLKISPAMIQKNQIIKQLRINFINSDLGYSFDYLRIVLYYKHSSLKIAFLGCSPPLPLSFK